MSLFSEIRRRNVLRVAIAYLAAAWLLTEVAGTLFPMFGFGDEPARITVIGLAIGFPLFLVFSWVFEITPEGLKLEKHVDRAGPALGSRRLDRAIIVLLALALGYFALDKFVIEPLRVAEIIEETTQQARSDARVDSYGSKSIAVLPFVNMTADPEQEYFSDGISEELINLLTNIPELRVTARTSAFYYKGKSVKLSQLARELGVAHILEGSVRKAGNRVRITVQLSEAGSETQIWSQTYDRTLADIFAIQDDVAARVIEQLKVRLIGALPTVRKVDHQAYALWLQGNHLLRDWNASSTRQAGELFKQALAIEPDFVDALFGLAELRREEADYRHALNEIIGIDPTYANAYARLGGLAIITLDLDESARHMSRALELAPASTFVLESATWLSIILGHLEEALEVYQYLIGRDPLNHLAYLYTGTVLLEMGRPQEALEAYSVAERIRPTSATEWGQSQALLFGGDPQAALDIALGRVEDVELYPGAYLSVSAMALHSLGRPREAADTLAILIERYGDRKPEFVAQVYAWSGDALACFTWLSRAVSQRKISDLYLSPAFKGVQDDPRWMDFLRSIGRTPEQLAAIDFVIPLPD